MTKLHLVHGVVYNFMQSMIDISADEGWLSPTLRVMHLVQMCVQGRWISDPSILMLPHFTASCLSSLKEIVTKSSLGKRSNVCQCSDLPELLALCQQDMNFVESVIHKVIPSNPQAREVCVEACVQPTQLSCEM